MRALERADLARRAAVARLREPNSSISRRSGCIVAQLIATNGPSARRERACSSRPTTSLPEPGAPVTRTRLPVGATRSICWPQLVDRRRGADQVEFAAGAQPQFRVFAAQLRRLDRARDDQQQPVALERLFDEIVGAELDRLDRRLDRAVAADHDDRHRRHVGLHPVQDLDAVELAVLEPDVEDHQRRLPRLDRRKRLARCRPPRASHSLRRARSRQSASGCRLRRLRSGCHAPWPTGLNSAGASCATGTRRSLRLAGEYQLAPEPRLPRDPTGPALPSDLP